MCSAVSRWTGQKSLVTHKVPLLSTRSFHPEIQHAPTPRQTVTRKTKYARLLARISLTQKFNNICLVAKVFTKYSHGRRKFCLCSRTWSKRGVMNVSPTRTTGLQSRQGPQPCPTTRPVVHVPNTVFPLRKHPRRFISVQMSEKKPEAELHQCMSKNVCSVRTDRLGTKRSTTTKTVKRAGSRRARCSAPPTRHW